MMTSLGERAARLHWGDGLTWNQVAERLGVKREKARGAARRWKAKNKLEVSPNRPRIERDEQDNTLGLTSFTNRIKTLDQLLAACEVDLDEWRVDRHSIIVFSFAEQSSPMISRTS
jgi:DNA-binding transcriptional regulator LsrR (DeoR family)